MPNLIFPTYIPGSTNQSIAPSRLSSSFLNFGQSSEESSPMPTGISPTEPSSSTNEYTRRSVETSLIPTPPTTPERSRRIVSGNFLPNEPPSFLSTPTRLGSWLSAQQTSSPERPHSVCLFDFLDKPAFQNAFENFLSTSPDPADRTRCKDIVTSYLQRILNVGKSFKFTCPSDMETSENSRSRMFRLMFAFSPRCISLDIDLICLGTFKMRRRMSENALRSSVQPPLRPLSVMFLLTLDIGFLLFSMSKNSSQRRRKICVGFTFCLRSWFTRMLP